MISDAIRGFTGSIEWRDSAGSMAVWDKASGVFFGQVPNMSKIVRIHNYADGDNDTFFVFSMDVSRQVPVSHENRPVSVSAFACITY